ncbi:MAG: nucleoside deaminase, partial [bacterium]
ALAWARIRHVYFGAYDPKSGGLTHGARVFDHPTCHHKPGHTGGLLEKETGLLLQTFFQDKRPL